MQISGEKFYFLMQVLKDSLEIQSGYDWNFEHKLEARKKFYDELMKIIITQDFIEIK